jgi:protein-S-isoprenylcysteine O-methyltransferase Ste14
MKKTILEIVFGAILIAVGVLIILFFKDFAPRYIGGAIIAAFGAVLVTSGIIGCAKK